MVRQTDFLQSDLLKTRNKASMDIHLEGGDCDWNALKALDPWTGVVKNSLNELNPIKVKAILETKNADPNTSLFWRFLIDYKPEAPLVELWKYTEQIDSSGRYGEAVAEIIKKMLEVRKVKVEADRAKDQKEIEDIKDQISSIRESRREAEETKSRAQQELDRIANGLISD